MKAAQALPLSYISAPSFTRKRELLYPRGYAKVSLIM